MDHQQNRRAEPDLHAGTEREAGCNREGGDVAGMQGRRKRHLTARIKPATKHALMAQLALAADVIISQGEQLESARRFVLRQVHADFREALFEGVQPRPWWRRLLGLR